MSLYRKYRPQTFSEMVGQNHIKLTLQNELEQGSFVHAYLFCGPRGLGKTTAARLFAKSVNCENRKEKESEPCNKCSSCEEIMAGKALDLIEIDAASHTGVDNVRENIIENTRFSPNKSKFKVFIIDEVHMLSISAFNALLKTLEEPPAHVIFILCTTELHKIPETIISRCQRFDFKKVPSLEMIKRLKKITDQEKIKLDDEVFDIIAQKSEGCMRDAESLLGQVLSLGGQKISKEQAELILPFSEIKEIISFVQLLIQNNISSSLDFINNLVEQGTDLEIFTKELIEFLRKSILIKVGASKINLLDLPEDRQKEIGKLLELVNIDKIIKMINIFLQVNSELKSSPIIQLPLELAVIGICETGSTNVIENVSKPVVFRNPAITTNSANSASPASLDSSVSPVDSLEKEKGSKKVEATPSQSSEAENQNSELSNSNVNNVNLEDIKTKWIEVIKAGHKKSRDLQFMTEKMIWPLNIAGNTLELGFKYELHQSRFNANSNKSIFEKALKDILGINLNVKSKTLKPSELADLDIAKVKEEAKNEKLSGTKVVEENILEQVLDSFGGEVVE